jgi:hypothetical protein
MRLKIIKKENGNGLNVWAIITIAAVIVVGVGSYLVLESAAFANQTTQFGILNFECASYGNKLTSELAANSSVCLQASATNKTLASCGAVFYCAYTPSCAAASPVSNSSTLSCQCDALRNDTVVVSGLCLKQALS